MDRTALEELFAYTQWTWGQYEATIRPLGKSVVAPVPGSGWPALRDVLAHVNLSYDGWLEELTGTPMIGLDVESAGSWDEVDGHRGRVRSRLRQYMESLSDSELTTARRTKVGDNMLECSPGDVITHALLHERGHHGDINTLLYHLGVEPPLVDYIGYRFSRDWFSQTGAQ